MNTLYGRREIMEAGDTCFLLTNGLGGFSSLTITGSCQRNDHALLIASVNPPVGRMHMVSNLHEALILPEQNEMGQHLFAGLSSQCYLDASKNGMGACLLQSFCLQDGIPVWQYQYEDYSIEKTMMMVQERNAVLVRYQVDSAREGVLQVVPWYQFVPKGTILEKEQKFFLGESSNACVLRSNGLELYFWCNGQVVPTSDRYEDDRYYEMDAVDGRDERGVTFTNHDIYYAFEAGRSEFFIYYDMEEFEADFDSEWLDKMFTKEQSRYRKCQNAAGLCSEFGKDLSYAASQYISERSSTNGKTILAGFPYFGDWGRDTMIAMLGVTLQTKRFDDAKNILTTFAQYERDGLLPNMFPDRESEPMYNTVDAALLYIEAVYQYVEQSGDRVVLSEWMPVMLRIMECYEQGTVYQIHMDEDGLIYAGEKEQQLTWMDVRIDHFLPTPRHGKAVEINAYWYNALKIMEQFCQDAGMDEKREHFKALAKRTKKSFLEKFWWEEKGCLYDVVEGMESADNQQMIDNNIMNGEPIAAQYQIRPNQVWALTLSFIMPDERMAESILSVVRRELYTPYGLRSLSKYDPQFQPEYRGAQKLRDLAYHQGTVWLFPLGAYDLARLRFARQPKLEAEKIWKELRSLEASLREGCIGQLCEVMDGLYPERSKGCFAQAWSVGELLRVVAKLEQLQGQEEIDRETLLAFFEKEGYN